MKTVAIARVSRAIVSAWACRILAQIDVLIIVALVTSGASLAAAVFAQIGTRRTATSVAELGEQRAERDARRDYEYEARKRLYEECEPLLFQALELAGAAQGRISSLARSARAGELKADGSGWLGPDRSGWVHEHSYYLVSTAYRLIAPATTFRLLQGRLTVVDLRLDYTLRMQYEILKLVFASFNEDFALAEVAPVLDYEPNRPHPAEPDREHLLDSCPARYARQGLVRGVLELVVEALIVQANGHNRLMTYGEFALQWNSEGSQVHGVRDTLLDLVGGFHPQRKPVLWRVLLVQYELYSLLLGDGELAAPELVSEETCAGLDWRADVPEATVDEILEPVRIARTHVLTVVTAAKGNAVRDQL